MNTQDPQYIWQVSLKSGDYGGSTGITEEIERQILDCERDYYKWDQTKKRLFLNRKDAEDYVRPIAQKAFQTFISNWEDNLDENETDKNLDESKKRGLQEIRKEELIPDSLYYSKIPSTTFVCPAEHEYDRIGHNFATITLIRVY
jgi:hypothetical protein